MQQTVLYIEIPGYKPFPEASVMRVAATGATMISVTDSNAAEAALRSTENLKAIVTNGPNINLMTLANQKHPSAAKILITDLTMEEYSRELHSEEHTLLDHIVSNRTPSNWTTNELRVTMQKILRQDYFGIDKYLAPFTPILQKSVTGSADRENFNSSVMKFAEENRLGQYMSKLVFGITEELLMNAIYDAPMAGGAHHYSDLPRTSQVTLQPSEFATLSYGSDGSVFGISVTDPFGALDRNILFKYLKKVLRRQDSNNLIDTKQGGAGLGLFKILYSSHSLVCNVQKGQRTEVMALIDIHHQVRDFSRLTRSICYFEEKQNNSAQLRSVS